MAKAAVSPIGGSSPLARGGQIAPGGGIRFPGLIPAGAGRTRPSRRRCSGTWAHPRWRGADNLWRVGRRRAHGSSPLARGGRQPRIRAAQRPGLIPAGAGRTASRQSVAPTCGAHPRWRGADHEWVNVMDWSKGSSPLARGGPPRHRRGHRPARLIPAGAGRTSDPLPVRGSLGAHPRWRGADMDIDPSHAALVCWPVDAGGGEDVAGGIAEWVGGGVFVAGDVHGDLLYRP